MTCVPEGSHLSSPDHGRACRRPVPLGRSWPVPRAVVGYPTCGTRPPPLRTGSLLPTLAFEEASSANGASPPVCSTRPPFRRFPAPPPAPPEKRPHEDYPLVPGRSRPPRRRWLFGRILRSSRGFCRDPRHLRRYAQPRPFFRAETAGNVAGRSGRPGVIVGSARR